MSPTVASAEAALGVVAYASGPGACRTCRRLCRTLKLYGHCPIEGTPVNVLCCPDCTFLRATVLDVVLRRTRS